MQYPLKIAGLSILLICLLSACGGDARDPEPTESQRPVKMVDVEDVSDMFSTSFPAVFQAAQSTRLTFQVGGLLRELPVVDGDMVEQGGLIARLDQRDYQNSFNSAKAQYDNAESEYHRARRLFAENAVSRSLLEQRLSQRDVAKAQFDIAKKALDDTTLVAPYAGRIAEVLVENFQNVSPQQSIIVFQSDGDIEAVINVPARLIAFLPQIQPLDPTVTLDVAPDLQIPATFKEATVQADPTTQSYRAIFTFDPPDELLILPGMTGSVRTTFLLMGNELVNGVTAPLGSIMVEGDEHFVWVVDRETMTVSKRKISIAKERLGDTVTIDDGLETGETIVSAGAAYLHDGMKVREWKNN